ncbi:aminotransferase class I/II-fold pyridoxal phosphate-dependent enzyme [Roseicyclus sp. F158]|uniref:Aminotransferase n=1 Tax=Tropicimonas omnivorans TaxID=3075590 RepID=A0ABU3DCD1_9RHOB|nr:aminotransferase class I/II-fold pyridoxal phosphate-dependent enzyme [Roseicyclus sp. F158]MDT0681371.1 aminotransferase class I/II-fold pyridoxal phosphate-dependent enzyme [Roseicyclus sp. F158]
MTFPGRFSSLPDYVFPRLRKLLDGREPGAEPFDMTIGEPRHGMPDFVAEIMAEEIGGFARYPKNEGTEALREAIAGWLGRRYGAALDPDSQIISLNGSREGLFHAALALCPEEKAGQRPAILTPNPFYGAYTLGAPVLGADLHFVSATEETGYLPRFDELPEELLQRTALVYVGSPSNPHGAVASMEYWEALLGLAERHGFTVLADECYSEIYRDVPPPGAFEALQRAGTDPERLVVFNSLSKRSNLPGLRAGFAAGGKDAIARMKLLRAWGGAPLPGPIQAVAARAWSDETHVEGNRLLYRQKYDLADEIFGEVPGYSPPEAGFFLWLPVDDGEDAAIRAWEGQGLRILPGAYFARGDADDVLPGTGRVRVAMVAPVDDLRGALHRLRDVLYD